MRGFQNRSAG